MTNYCNKDDNMRFCSVEMKDSTEQNLIPPVKLQYHCLDRSLRYVDLLDSLNSERNPGCCYSKNDFATGRRAGYGVRTVIIWNLRRQLAARRGSRHRRSICRCVSGSCSQLISNYSSFEERRAGCRRLLVVGAASHNTAAIRKRTTARSGEIAPCAKPASCK